MSEIVEKKNLESYEFFPIEERKFFINSLISKDIAKIALALSKAQATIENVGKDKQGYGYKYADLASCLQAIKKPMSDNGLSITQLVTSENDKPMLITLLMHESGQWLKSVFPIESVIVKTKAGTVTGNSLQHLGAGLTYCRRYALSAIMGLAQEDDDAQCLTVTAKPIKDKPVSIDNSNSLRLKQLCEENHINPKEFAKVFDIRSQDPETVVDAVNRFDQLKEEFKEATL
jgi:hypothetical protein